jgi:hypothetical protein
LGKMDSMCGSRRGYNSRRDARSPRWTEDLSLDLGPGEML